MAGFENRDEQAGFAMKLWRGERMCLLGFDVDHPEDDFVGFAVEFRAPDMADWEPLKNRLAFSYSQPVAEAVDGNRKFDSTLAPFQKFRWIHFPWQPKAGIYRYRATKMHMPSDERLVTGTSIALDISLDPVTYDGFLDVGFTRNFASSQAYAETFHNRADIIPADPDDGLAFDPAPFQREYQWLGFEARSLMFDFLDRIASDAAVTLDVLAYDFNEPELLQRLERFGPRLRAVIDDSGKKKNGKLTGHGSATSPESQAATALAASAGAGNVRRTHFKTLQHNKVFIARRDGAAFRVLTGSTNFSFRGLYIQANNVLVFDEPAVAKLYAEDFDRAFADPGGFAADDIARKWYAVAAPGRPALGFCFSPHKSDALSLNPVAAAVDGATSSVFYAVAFLNQIEAGPTHDAFDRLIGKPVFSYGVVDKRGALEIKKPDGSVGLVGFQLSRGQGAGAVQDRVERRPGDQYPPQVRGDRLQPRDRQGLHRFVQSLAERREGKRRQPDPDRGPQGRDRLCDRGAARVRSPAFPLGHAGQARTQADRAPQRRQSQARGAGRGAGAAQADRDFRQARLVRALLPAGLAEGARPRAVRVLSGRGRPPFKARERPRRTSRRHGQSDRINPRGRDDPDRGTAVHDLGATSKAQDKNPLDKQDVPRNARAHPDWIQSGCALDS
jgi:hypothetical protein